MGRLGLAESGRLLWSVSSNAGEKGAALALQVIFPSAAHTLGFDLRQRGHLGPSRLFCADGCVKFCACAAQRRASFGAQFFFNQGVTSCLSRFEFVDVVLGPT